MKATLWVSVKYLLERQTKALEDAKLKLSEHEAELSRAQSSPIKLDENTAKLTNLVRWAQQEVEAAQDAVDAIKAHFVGDGTGLVKLELEV